MLGRCSCGSFCISVTCVGFPQPPKLTLCVTGLCALDSQFPKVHPESWACVHLSHLRRRTLCVVIGLVCTCFLSVSALFVMGVTCSSSCVPEELCVLPKFVCLPSIRTPVLPFEGAMFVCQLRGPTLCAEKVVCAGWVCRTHHSGIPKPTFCLGPESMSC